MLARVFGAAQVGMEGRLVEVECDMSASLPGLVVVGLGSKAVEEARDRIRGAIKNAGLMVPPKRITINLAPADLPKEGSGYDLAMAMAVLVSSEQLPQDAVDGSLFVGELGLDASVRPVPGVLAAARLAAHIGLDRIFVPADCAAQAAMIRGVAAYPLSSLRQAYEHLCGRQILQPQARPRRARRVAPQGIPDFRDISGHDEAKRAMVVAAAGGHNVLLSGPPGSGKTMLSRATLGLLPPPDDDEHIEILQLHGLAGIGRMETPDGRPFRAPHHTASDSAMIGGGRTPRPGEVSLAHHGILFLDELPEFRREVLDALRQPLEDATVTVARAAGVVTFPAQFMLVAARNPCPCGYAGDRHHACRCTAAAIERYGRHVSGPLLDRIDVAVHVPGGEHTAQTDRGGATDTAGLAKAVLAARQRQHRRLGRSRLNAMMGNAEITRHCQLDKASKELLQQAGDRLHLSGRGYFRTLRIARTIADLAGDHNIGPAHLAEAIGYRPKS